jgi:hypothetical protein
MRLASERRLLNKSMNAHLKDTMSAMISSFHKDAQWQLQFTSLASKLDIKDTLIRESLYICNRNFDRRMKLHCVQTSKDEWIMWEFPETIRPNTNQDLDIEIPKFLNVFQVHMRTFLDVSFLDCDCCFYERCGIPCEHVFLLTNTLTHEMIKIQHWKIYASHYDSTDPLGRELKKCQLDTMKYEGMGVPIGTIVLESIRVHDRSCAYPYLYFGTQMEDYKEAMYILENKQCITEYEYRKISTTTATNEMTQLHDFIIDDMNMICPAVDGITDDTVFDNSSVYHGNYEGDLTDMMCAAVDGPSLLYSPLKTTQLFPHTPTPLKNGVIASKDQSLYLTPTTRVFQQDLKIAAESVPEIYDDKHLKIIRKNVIESIESCGVRQRDDSSCCVVVSDAQQELLQ